MGTGQIFCSSPTAPGWDTNLADGGCGTEEDTQVATMKQLIGYLQELIFLMGKQMDL